MPIIVRRKDKEETEEYNADEEAKREEENKAEEARKAEIEAAKKEAEQARIEAATAKGEAEALRRGMTKVDPPIQWTDEQWEAEAAKHGTTGAALKAQVEISKAVSIEALKPLKEEAAAARKEAQEAREETNRLRASRTRENAESNFYKKNPALEAHKNLVDEFMSSYPDADTIDSKTYEKRLSFAVDIVKGKVKENMRTKKPSETGSSRLEVDDREETRGEESSEFDPRGTGNEGAAYLMAKIHSGFGQGLKHEDSIEVWKKYRDDEDRGVSISMDEDKELARQIQDRPLIGGKRGSR